MEIPVASKGMHKPLVATFWNSLIRICNDLHLLFKFQFWSITDIRCESKLNKVFLYTASAFWYP